jgi:hypothetical protein
VRRSSPTLHGSCSQVRRRRAPLVRHEVAQELERDRRREVADTKRAKREAKMSDRDAVREAVDVLWDIILRADNDQAVVMLLCSGRQWQDDANCYAHVLHCEFMGTSRNAVEVYLRRRVSEAFHGDRWLLFWRGRGTPSSMLGDRCSLDCGRSPQAWP